MKALGSFTIVVALATAAFFLGRLEQLRLLLGVIVPVRERSPRSWSGCAIASFAGPFLQCLSAFLRLAGSRSRFPGSRLAGWKTLTAPPA